MMPDDQRLSLQAFLQVLTSRGLPVSRAMMAAGKMFLTRKFNTPARLGELTDSKLASLGVSDKDDRGLVLSALSAAGFRAITITNAKQREAKKRRTADAIGPSARDEETSTPHGEPSTASPAKKRRKRDDVSRRLERNEFLPGPPTDEGATLGSLDFHELLDQDALKHKSAVVNRAPVMMAWACVVAERLGFSREEALSIASVKGVSIGVYDKKREADLKTTHAGGTQPYVDLLGRRVPLYRNASGAWRAFTTEDSDSAPGAAYGYITRALRQTAPAVLGAMRLLAESYSDPMELNRVGFALYADFRPEVTGWGKRGELMCEVILALRKTKTEGTGALGVETGVTEVDSQTVVKYKASDGRQPTQSALGGDSDGSNNPLDDPFEEFTIEELGTLP
ncbi:hypothetical protein EDB85DRAFT_1906407 [Lactarius pseudohatsudake]|nr:hypothetical protein EDB85DRAFT_1906407 [Lactarius pseudohatsudake]